MRCTVLAIVIILIIFAIIGMITIKILQDEKHTNEQVIMENFEQMSLELGTTISDNAKKINDLLTDLSTANMNVIKPNFELKNVNTDGIYRTFGNNITSNVGVVNRNLSNYYNTGSNTVSNQISNVEKSLLDLENIVEKLNSDAIQKKNYSRIKSLNNGQEFTLFNTENQNTASGFKAPRYLVGVNNGCLSVGANDYDVYKCDDKNPNQYFKMQHIMNKDMYQNAIDTALPIDNTDFNKINYPFVMLKSVNTENCLTNNHGSLTVQPCYTFESQRWFAL